MNAGFSFYDVLGVSSTATLDDIRFAYHAAILKYHPDVNTAPNAQRLTEILNDAYAVLSDPAKRQRYDAALESGTPMAEPGEEPDELWELYACDQCNTVDIDLRYALFYKVWSIVIYSQMKGEGGILCSECRSKMAVSTALFSAFLGPWGFPWGIIYALRSLFASIRGGEMPRQQNVQLLRHQGLALFQRGHTNEARACLIAAQRFEKNDAVAALLNDPAFHNSADLPGLRWLRGQTIALGLLAVPPVLVILLFIWAGSTPTSAGSASPSTDVTASRQSNVDALTALLSDCRAKPTSGNVTSRYDSCKRAVSWISDDLKSEAPGTINYQTYELIEDFSRAYQGNAAWDLGNKSEAKSLIETSVTDLRQLENAGLSNDIRQKATSGYNCLENNDCQAPAK